MMFRRLLLATCLAVIILFAQNFSTAHAQEDAHIEYRSVLEIDAADLSAGLPEGWLVVEGDAIDAQIILENTEQWQVETDDSDSDEISLNRRDRIMQWTQYVEPYQPSAEIRLTPVAQPLSLVSPLIPLEETCVGFSGVVLGSGENDVVATLRWISDGALVQEDALIEPPASTGERRRLNLPETERPSGAQAAQIVLTVQPKDGASFRCAIIRLTGMFSSHREVALFANQIAYEQGEPKMFTVRANFRAQRAAFTLIDMLGYPVLNGELSPPQGINGADGASWSGYYYQGDFSEYDAEGKFTLRVMLDQTRPMRVPVRIGFNALWEEAFAPALAPFKRLRVAGAEEDETLQLWDPAFSGGASDAALLWDIVRSCSILQGRFSADPAFAPLNEEALYGVERLAQWVLAGHSAANQEELALYAATLACGAGVYPDIESVAAAAQQLMEQVMREDLSGALPFSAAMDMYDATQESGYLEYAQRIFPGISVERVEPLLNFEELTGQLVTIQLNNHLMNLGESLVKAAANPFGLASPSGARGGFFLWEADAPDPLRGNSARILAAVELMAQAYRYTANGDFKTFVYDQFNWIMGNNPYGACLIVGLGESDETPVVLPDGMTRDDAYGAVLHGIGPYAADKDLPRFALTEEEAKESTNGISLYNNARYISAMAYLKRIPVMRPRGDG